MFAFSPLVKMQVKVRLFIIDGFKGVGFLFKPGRPASEEINVY
jgi:hypothetical protein